MHWVDHWVSCEVLYNTGKLWYTAFQQYILYTCSITISQDITECGCSAHHWDIDHLPFCGNNEQTTWVSVEYLIPLESCDIQLSNSVCYIFVALLYPKISPKVAAPLISCALSGPSTFLWYNEWTISFLVEYFISLESCNIQLSNSMYYILVALLYPKTSLKAAALLITGILRGPSPFLWQ